MAVAPLIKPIQTQKGMFYTFQSSIEDLSLTFSNNSNKFKFSKFALLRIPEIGIPTDTVNYTDNKVQFLALGETPLIANVSTNQNLNLANSFQNYALNLESLLISQDTYKREKKLNVSERVFWKWLKELGAIRWRNATSLEVIPTLPAGENRWAEDFADPSISSYNRVVKYIGDIDVVNTVQNNQNSYSEIYIHVPTNVGSSPTVLFNSVPDDNYGPATLVVNTPGDPLDLEYLNGRHYYDTHPYSGMSLQAFYDLDADSVVTKLSDTTSGVINWSSITSPYTTGSGQGVGFWWGPSSIQNSYYTDQAAFFGTPHGVSSSTIKNQRIHKSYVDPVTGTRTVEYVRSTLDGAVIDFDLNHYKIAAENTNIKSLAQLNDSYSNSDFEFNAVLIYYDVYDPTGTSNGGEPASATNLYGIYFLNKVVQSGSEFIIPIISKKKPDVINKTNGNSFAFKVNFKFDTSIEDVTVERSINDYNTFSLDLFTDVLTQMRLLQTKFNDKILELQNLATDVELAKDALLNTTALSSLAKRISSLETTVSVSTAAFSEATSIMKLIDNTNDRIDQLLKGNTSLQVSFLTDSFRQGTGMSLDKNTPGQVIFSADVQAYQTTVPVDISSNSSGIKTVSLGYGGTQVRHLRVNGSGSPIPWTLTSDVILAINDTTNNWKTGQILRLVFDSQVIPGSYNIFVKTDAQNITNSIAPYSISMVNLSAVDFPTTFGRTGQPIIDIVCTDSKTLTFTVDKILR
jgi:hypothetical protein